MRETNHKEPEFDDLDAAIAAALGDASAWPVPRDGFEERCAARVEEILQADQTRRPFRLFGGTPFLKLAASFAVVLGTASLVYNAVVARVWRRRNGALRGGGCDRHRSQVRADGEDAGKGKVAARGDAVSRESVRGERHLTSGDSRARNSQRHVERESSFHSICGSPGAARPTIGRFGCIPQQTLKTLICEHWSQQARR